jgi:hypothetical protein
MARTRVRLIHMAATKKFAHSAAKDGTGQCRPTNAWTASKNKSARSSWIM